MVSDKYEIFSTTTSHGSLRVVVVPNLEVDQILLMWRTRPTGLSVSWVKIVRTCTQPTSKQPQPQTEDPSWCSHDKTEESGS